MIVRGQSPGSEDVPPYPKKDVVRDKAELRSTLRVLSLEDDPNDTELLLAHLRSFLPTSSVAIARDGAQFEKVFQEGEFDLVLADYTVPGYDGLRALAFVRERNRDIPFIFVSGRLGEELAIDALRSGATDYVNKEHLARLKPAITRALSAAAESQKREEYFRALTELSSDVVAVLRGDGMFRYLSPSVGAVLGYDPAVLLQCNPFELLHPDDVPVARKALEQVVADAKPIPKIEVRVQHQNGEWRVMELVGRNLLDDPSVAGVILNIRDVTERKQAELRIREQAALLDKAQDAIMVCDLESRILFWNKSAERVYGWSSADAVQQNADHLLFGSAEARPLTAVKGLIAKGEWHGELVQINRARQEIIVESRWSLVRSDDGQPESILIINTDVTQTRKLQAQFLRAQRMESVGALAGGIAHDLNNVLAPVLMAAELLREKVTDPECRQWLDTLSSSAMRGAEVVRQILSFARGTGEELVEIQVRHLLNDHVKMLKETFPRSISIETHIERDLATVRGNATKLSQVLMNLSVNARDAMPNGGQIRIRARKLSVDTLVAAARPGLRPGAHVVITVADTGTGIPRELMGRIFEPFFTTKDVTKGTGLGLATALGIIKSHSGALSVYSEVGKGTQFDIYLPALPTATAPSASLPAQPLPRGSGECVLIVDDEAPSREMIGATLRTHGYEVLLAENGADGLRLYHAHRDQVDLVITDMAMPIMDGRALIRALHASSPDLRILTLSGLVEHPTLISGSDEDVHILEKPCTAEDLLTHVCRALAARKRRPRQT